MKGAHAYFTGSGGIRLHYQCWEVSWPRGVVLISHGMGEHSGRYSELAYDFARAGLSTYALDHRGHGRSDGRRGHVRRFVRYIHDLEKFRRRVVGAVGPEVPLVFVGHSLGGLILVRYLQEYPAVSARGAVLSSPLLGVAMAVPKWKEKLGRLLYYSVPALPMSTGLDPRHLSHDTQVVDAYERDPLVHDRITPRTYGELGREVQNAFSRVARLRVPLLVLVASADEIVRPDQIQRFARIAAETVPVESQTFAGMYHEVLNETRRSRVLAHVLGWIERRIGVYSLSPVRASSDPVS